MTALTRSLLVVAALALVAPTAAAQEAPPDLSRVSLEDLMTVEITSAARTAQRLGDTAAAVHVITREDIRRSGMTTLPDLLRLVPGVQVAQINGNKWAVSVRGFNSLYANKLLVLIDGRSVYNRLFSGVVWDEEDVPLEDIERIEVIRGPGGALWGANAVNGVINIVTRSAHATRGTAVQVRTGTTEPFAAGARFGGAAGEASYRVFSQMTAGGRSSPTPDASLRDELHRGSFGGRLDWRSARSEVTLAAHLTAARAQSLWLPPTVDLRPNISSVLPGRSRMSSGAVLGRWVRGTREGGTLQLQMAADFARRDEPAGLYERNAIEIEVERHRRLARRHDVVWGAGLRRAGESLDGRSGYALTPARTYHMLFNTYVQDTVSLAGGRVMVTSAARVEHETDLGWRVQPTARVLWSVVPDRHRLWAAVSRAERTPSLLERGVSIDFPLGPSPEGLPMIFEHRGNPSQRPESLTAVEAGYRLSLGHVHLDVAGFRSRYGALATVESGTPGFAVRPDGPAIVVPGRFDNLLEATAAGAEVTTRCQVGEAWRLEASHSRFAVTDRGGLTRAPAALRFDAHAPGQQSTVRSLLTFARGTLDISVMRVGRLAALDVPAYTRADVRGEWPVTRTFAVSVTGQNLFGRHVEFAAAATQLFATAAPRALAVRLAWSIR